LKRKKTVAELTQHVINTVFKDKKDMISLTNARLRKYDAVRRIPGEPLFNNDQKLEDVDLRKEKKLILEIKKDDEMFHEYQPDKTFLVRVVKYDKSFQPEVEVDVPLNATLGQFKSELEKLFDIPANRQRIVTKVFTNVFQQEKILSGESKELKKDLKVQPGDTLYVEKSEGDVNDPNDSGVMKELEHQKYTMTIRYQIDRSLKVTLAPDVKQDYDKVINTIDRRRTIGDLKDLISSQIGISVDNFKLSKGPDDSAYTFNDTDEKLLQLVDGCTVYVKSGKQMSKQQFNVTFYFHEEKKKSAASLNKSKNNGYDSWTCNPSSMDDGSPHNYNLRSRGMMDVDYHLPHMHMAPHQRPVIDEPDSVHYGAAADSSWTRTERIVPPKRVKFEDEDEDDHWKWSWSNSTNQSFKKLFDTVLPKNTTVREVKQMLIEKAISEKSDLVSSDTTTHNIRLREKLHGRNYPGKILLDDDNPYEALASSVTSSVPNREIIIQKVANPEPITPDDMVIRIAQFRPSKWQLSRREEIIINKNMTIAELKQRIINIKFFSQSAMDIDNVDETQEVTADVIDIVKIPYQMAYQLKNNEFMMKLNWQDNKPDQIVTKAPWFLDDGDLVLFKVATEVDWFTLNDKQLFKNEVPSNIVAAAASEYINGSAAQVKALADKVAGANNSGQPTAISTTTSQTNKNLFNRERALRFYTDDEESDKKEANSKTPTENGIKIDTPPKTEDGSMQK
jgi:hypothetical protein